MARLVDHTLDRLDKLKALVGLLDGHAIEGNSGGAYPSMTLLCFVTARQPLLVGSFEQVLSHQLFKSVQSTGNQS